MKLSEEMKSVVQNAPYITFTTINQNGSAHPIIVGGKEPGDENIIIGIYKMERTQKNLLAGSKAWITAATVDGGPKGYRFEGTASVMNEKVVFIPEAAEIMI